MNQDLDAFRKIVNETPEMQQEVLAMMSTDQGIDSSALQELAKRFNFSFDQDEINQYISQTMDDSELSDFELEMVAAGTPFTCYDT